MYKVVYERVKTDDGFELDVEIRNPGVEPKKTVVMCHGLTSTKQCRRKQLFKLANRLWEDDYRVIQFDFRGHGDSSGSDIDVSLTSFHKDLTTIINKYCDNDDFFLFGFSNGGLAVSQYLYLNKNTSVKKVVLIAPPLNPIESSFLNPNTICYEDLHKAYVDGSLEKNGYVFWNKKNWTFSKQFLDECHSYNYKEAMKYLSGRSFILQGLNDKNVDYTYNEKYAKEYNMKYKSYEACHSLYEVIDDAIQDIIDFYNE